MTGTRRHSSVRTALVSLGLLALLVLLTATAAAARTPDARERGLLDFIGAIESNGYDDYYREVAEGPPQPLTTMTVGEVLAWQDRIDARSRSEAAGRYQITEDTLRGLVRQGVVSPDARFDAPTQDALALYLLDRRGWDPNRTDYVPMGNAIAHEWAALPICSGYRTGRSAYDGIAGNSARTTCETWLSVLANPENPVAVANAIALSRIVVASRAALPTNILEDFLERIRFTFFEFADPLIAIAINLLLSLLLIEWVWTTARQISEGVGTAAFLSTLAQRLALTAIFLFVINLGHYGDLVIRSAEALLDVSTEGASIDIITIFDRLVVLAFDLLGRSVTGVGEKIAAIVILIVGAMLIGLIVVAYIEVYIAFAAAVIALGFAGWSGTRHIAVAYLRHAAKKVMTLFTALFCGAVISLILVLDVSHTEGEAFLVAGYLVVLGLVMIRAPDAMEQAMTGRAGASAGGKLAGKIGGVPGMIWRYLIGK